MGSENIAILSHLNWTYCSSRYMSRRIEAHAERFATRPGVVLVLQRRDHGGQYASRPPSWRPRLAAPLTVPRSLGRPVAC